MKKEKCKTRKIRKIWEKKDTRKKEKYEKIYSQEDYTTLCFCMNACGSLRK